jgi:hypothetical protein
MKWPTHKIFPLFFVLLFLIVSLSSRANDTQIATLTGKVVLISDDDTISAMREDGVFGNGKWGQTHKIQQNKVTKE